MSQTLSVAPKRVTKREAMRRLAVSEHVINNMIETGELKTAPRLGKQKAIIFEASLDQAVALIIGEDRQAG